MVCYSSLCCTFCRSPTKHAEVKTVKYEKTTSERHGVGQHEQPPQPKKVEQYETVSEGSRTVTHFVNEEEEGVDFAGCRRMNRLLHGQPHVVDYERRVDTPNDAVAPEAKRDGD